MPAGNEGSCIHQNKYPVQDDKYNYHDFLQVCLIKGTGHLLKIFVLVSKKYIFFSTSEGSLPEFEHCTVPGKYLAKLGCLSGYDYDCVSSTKELCGCIV